MGGGRAARRARRRVRPGALVAGAVALACLTIAPAGATPQELSAPQPTGATEGPPAPLRRSAQHRGSQAGRTGDSGADQLTQGAAMRSTMVGEKGFSYCSNGSLDDPSPETRRVVFVVHGNDRQPCGMVASVLAAANEEQRRTTLVIAPRFATAEDKVDRSRELYWTFHGWSQGDASVNPGLQMSSYQVLDELISRLQQYPQTVAGFSGGGQFVGRFLSGSRSNPQRFVVANPSSYLYFDNRRPGTPPQQLAACPGYDEYRYGLQKLNPYMASSGARGLLERYRNRRVVYLIGDADNDPKSSSMDKSCGANAQGANRLERAQRYWAYLPTVFGPRIRQQQAMYPVPGAGHEPAKVFRSPQARQALFES